MKRTPKAKLVDIAAEGSGRRKRQSDVRGRILKFLESGPMGGPELLKKGKFSSTALYLNLKALKDEGLIDSRRSGKSVTISLTGATHASAAAADEPADTTIEAEVMHEHVAEAAAVNADAHAAASSSLVAPMVSKELHDALNAIAFRFSPVDRAQEKLVVLDQLARTMPAPVSAVLRQVIDDVVRLSSLHHD